MERPLQGLNAVVTGGTRGIGGATSLLLASEGAHVFAVSRDPGKVKSGRVDTFLRQAEGLPGQITWLLADITRPTDRERLVETILLSTTGGCRSVDVFVSNAAGGMDKQEPLAINSSAKIALLRELAPLLRKRSLTIEIESDWSRWYPHVEQLDRYEPVAISKKRGRERLFKEIPRVAEEFEKEILLAYVCGHGVAGTATWNLLNRNLSEAKRAELIATAAGGRLPTTEDMAQAVLRLIDRFYKHDLEFGATEYVGIPHWDDREVKKRFYMYGPNSLYLDGTVFHSPTQSFAFARARPEHFEPLFSQQVGHLDYRRPSRYQYSETSPRLLTSFVATEGHARDHFTEQMGLKIVPGYKLAAAAALSYSKDLNRWFGQTHRWAGTLGETRFLKPVLPGMLVDIYHMEEDGALEGRFAGKIELRVGKMTVATISGLLMKLGVDSNRHLKGRFIEMAAQAAGAQFLHLRELAGDDLTDLAPLFRSIGQIQFMGVVRPGETIETESRLSEVRRNGFTADTVLRVGDRTIAQISGINCGVLRGGARAIERIKRSIGEGV